MYFSSLLYKQDFVIEERFFELVELLADSNQFISFEGARVIVWVLGSVWKIDFVDF